jgi:hypothetical protein
MAFIAGNCNFWQHHIWLELGRSAFSFGSDMITVRDDKQTELNLEVLIRAQHYISLQADIQNCYGSTDLVSFPDKGTLSTPFARPYF